MMSKMKRVALGAFVGSSVLFAVVSAAEESRIAELTADNFYQKLGELPQGALVEFYAPWCGHCKQLLPILEDAHKELSEGDKLDPVPIMKFDATTSEEISMKFEIKGYPSLQWLKGDSAEVALKLGEYEGQRKQEDIVDYVRAMLRPAITEGKPTGEEKLSVVFKAGAVTEDYTKLAESFKQKATFFFEESQDTVAKMIVKHIADDAIEKKFLTKLLCALSG